MDGLLNAQTNLTLMQATQNDGVAQNLLRNNPNKDVTRIQKAAQDFEAVFIYEMMKPMFEGVEVDPLFGGGKGEEIFRGMVLQEYGQEIAAQDTTGLQSAVMNKLIEIQAGMNK